MRGRTLRLTGAVLFCLVVGQTPCSAQHLVDQTGTLTKLVAELCSRKYLLRALKDDPRPYVEPGSAVSSFKRIAALLEHDAPEEAAKLASQVDYEVVRFNDTENDRQYFVLRESADEAKPTRGWGAYLLNLKATLPAVVEVPHPLDDQHTPQVGMLVFGAGAKALLIAGAHRTKADVPDLVGSVFHTMHMAWVGPMAQTPAWQIHGFAIGKHRFPEGTQIVTSTGAGQVPQELRRFNSFVSATGFRGYVYNDLAPKSKINKKINDGVPGVTFASLAATKNEQGKYSRGMGGTFVHVELEQSVRRSKERRISAAKVIVAAIEGSAPPAPIVASEPVKPEVVAKVEPRIDRNVVRVSLQPETNKLGRPNPEAPQKTARRPAKRT